eukprot:3049910-Pyramimonas_sp.AAC.1
MDSHRLDPWTRWLVKEHDLRHPDTRAMLLFLLHMAHYDNVAIEKNQSWIRRVLSARSCETHPMSFHDATALWVMHHLRRELEAHDRARQSTTYTGHGGAASDLDDAAEAGRRQTQRGGGGAWRAFCSECMRAG